MSFDFSKLVTGEFPSELKEYLSNPFKNIPSLDEAIKLTKQYSVPLHPRYILYWDELTAPEFIVFLEFLLENLKIVFDKSNKFTLNLGIDKKKELEILGVEHKFLDNDNTRQTIEINYENSLLLFVNLGINPFAGNLDLAHIKQKLSELLEFAKTDLTKKVTTILSGFNGYEVRDKAGFYIGARMGRPEKAKMRKQFNDETRSHALFPVGEQGGRLKNLVEVLSQAGFIEEDFRVFYCEKCEKETIYAHCEVCGSVSTQRFFEKYSDVPLDIDFLLGIVSKIKNFVSLSGKKMSEGFDLDLSKFESEVKSYFSADKKVDESIIEFGIRVVSKLFSEIDLKQLNNDSLKEKATPLIKFLNNVRFKKIKLDVSSYLKNLREVLGPKVPFPKHVKGISDTINKHHTIEHLSKGFLRELNGVFVNKDGTVRYDMIEMGLTHFKPKEIGTSISKLKELGYTHDYLGKELVSDEQVLEIMPQDVILPDCAQSGDEFASDFVIKTGNFVDDLLEKLYKLPRFYNFKKKEDTIGHLIIGLAPHTSAGIIGRILGYSKTQGCFSHPVWHAAQRRNLDGDENGILLLLDGLINFSREYLPDRRGSRTMDVSLVLTSHLYLDQIDDEVHGMDIAKYYNLDFYRACEKFESPKTIKMEKISARLDKAEVDERYLGYGFTHDTSNMNDTIMCSSYKSVPSMDEKLDLQLDIAKKIRAVDADKVGTFVIDKHFMKDIKGNLRKFSQQNFRCTNCNEIYRRPPLNGKCVKCGEPSINFTISEGSVKKYLGPSFKIMKNFKVDPYVAEMVDLINLRVESVFGTEAEKQKGLGQFFEKK